MPATLHMDRNIEGTFLDNSPTFVRCRRNAIVTGIDVNAVGYDPNVMVKALGASGMPQLWDDHPSIANCPVQRHLVRGMAGNQASVEIYYETPQLGISVPTAGSFLIEATTAMVTEQVNLDGSHLPIVVQYTAQGATGNKKRIANINRLTPMRTLKITGSITGVPLPIFSACVGRVNGVTWQGLGIGFWLCTSFEFQATGSPGTFGSLDTIPFTVAATFVSRVYRDWKEYAFFVDETGTVPEIIFTGAQQQGLAAAMKQTYSFAQSGNGAYNGFATVGFYDLANFFAIFGF